VILFILPLLILYFSICKQSALIADCLNVDEYKLRILVAVTAKVVVVGGIHPSTFAFGLKSSQASSSYSIMNRHDKDWASHFASNGDVHLNH